MSTGLSTVHSKGLQWCYIMERGSRGGGGSLSLHLPDTAATAVHLELLQLKSCILLLWEEAGSRSKVTCCNGGINAIPTIGKTVISIKWNSRMSVSTPFRYVQPYTHSDLHKLQIRFSASSSLMPNNFMSCLLTDISTLSILRPTAPCPSCGHV